MKILIPVYSCTMHLDGQIVPPIPRGRRSERTIRCGIVGASGYAGAELVATLAAHPEAEIVSVQADGSAGRRWEDLHPGRAHLFRGLLEPFDPAELTGLDAVFLARPSGESARAASALVGKVGTVIDLSGDLRLPDAASYRKWYGLDHPAPELLGSAAYGLPELFGDSLRGAPLVACAGCYATVSLLASVPGVAPGGDHDRGSRSGAGHGGRIVISAVSGTTGAGRKADVELSYSEVSETVRAYRVGRHQHSPEIALGLSRATGREVSVTFVPHLAPLRRGIFATVVFPNTRRLGPEDLLADYRAAYAGRAFVRVIDPGERLPKTSDVAGTNFCDLAPVIDEEAGSIVVLGVLDNLVKGAAGQAVQVLNAVFGLPDETGLLPEPKKELRRA